MSSFIKRYGSKFRTKKAREELVKLVGNRRRKNIHQLLTKYTSIKQFTESLYNLAVQGKTVVLGKKGRDDYLRDYGYWDRIPIDRHEMRFIIRSGIYHACSTKDKSDHLEESDLQDALTRFCSIFLKGYAIEGINLGSAPGIVDLFIWSFSAEDRYNICGANPRCDDCILKCACLYALTNLHK
jgi:thermostable 8-oxoguanine DNA glycosylase